MAPTSTTVATLLMQTVYYHLDNFSPDSALFFAERLNAYDRSSESAYLLALCHFRLGDSRSAYEASKTAGYRGVHLGCAFIFAQACLDLERYKDGVTALEKARVLWTAKCSIGKHNSTARAPYPDAAAASCLLGKLYRAYDDKKKAIPCFEEALKANPFMWDAFTALCDMGVNVRIPNIFKHNESFARNFDPEPSTAAQATETNSAIPEPLQKKAGIQAVSHDSDPFEGHRSTAFQDVSSNNMLFADGGQNDPFSLSRLAAANARFNSNIGSRHAQGGMETPSGPITAVEPQISRLGSVQEPPQAPTRRTRAAAPVESNIFEAPPRMGYRLGAKRRERVQQEQPSELSESTIKGPPPAPSAIERKRTASGHPVQPRPANGEEPRRSARLNVLPRATASRATVGTTMGLGTTATREVKKARPPVSRIVRPGSGGTMGRVVSGNRKPMDDQNMDVDQAEAPRVKEPPPVIQAPPVKAVVEPEPVKIDEALRYILDLLKKLATGYLLSSQFQGQEAMSVFSTLLRNQQDTPWVLARMGRAQYEQANYGEAEMYFKRLRLIAPTRHEDMEVYSTILWHLRKETDLSFLAHELVDAVWDSPQAWCALGNAFSLACDHEQALRCFKRAIQLHPKFAYAYTLQGHEHVENEEYDKALTAYRQAIAADKRHYNAYYGIGKVFEKLGNYEKALSHYKAALVIHPTHAVLICCVGTVLQRQKNIGQALPYFNKAVELAPKAPEIRHKKARALMATGQLEAARDELMVLRDLAPDKAQVHFLLGKLCKMLDDSKGAVRHFTIALSLDPKASSQIKQEIEGLEGGMEDESMLP